MNGGKGSCTRENYKNRVIKNSDREGNQEVKVEELDLG
jgi:hypothetical protein